jgi:hypothetical protein
MRLFEARCQATNLVAGLEDGHWMAESGQVVGSRHAAYACTDDSDIF